MSLTYPVEFCCRVYQLTLPRTATAEVRPTHGADDAVLPQRDYRALLATVNDAGSLTTLLHRSFGHAHGAVIKHLVDTGVDLGVDGAISAANFGDLYGPSCPSYQVMKAKRMSVPAKGVAFRTTHV